MLGGEICALGERRLPSPGVGSAPTGSLVAAVGFEPTSGLRPEVFKTPSCANSDTPPCGLLPLAPCLLLGNLRGLFLQLSVGIEQYAIENIVLAHQR